MWPAAVATQVPGQIVPRAALMNRPLHTVQPVAWCCAPGRRLKPDPVPGLAAAMMDICSGLLLDAEQLLWTQPGSKLVACLL